MKNIAKICSTKWIQCRFAWRSMDVFVDMLNSRDDLEDLIKWARRKRLTGVRRHYQQLLGETEERLLFYQLRSRRIFGLAQWVYALKQQLQPSPAYYRGYASKYSRNH